jgi:Flp pilus assembly CpaF family ATPase
VGEVRSAEALNLLLALNSRLPGIATLHANSARQALVKLLHVTHARPAQVLAGCPQFIGRPKAAERLGAVAALNRYGAWATSSYSLVRL